MSTVQDGTELDSTAVSGSFWEIGNYKHTVKRIDDGYRLCNDLVSMVTERSEIEKTYAKSLKSWSKKWQDHVGKGPEYGSVQSAWIGLLSEADRLCELHLKVRQHLVEGIQAKIKQWQKENYHKSMMAFKEAKDAEDSFRKAQKPWAKRLEKVIKTMKDYHQACKSEKTAINQEKNAMSDSSVSEDQKKKLSEKVERSQKDVELSKEKYELALQEITGYNAEYMENMTDVFQKCQGSEMKRQEFFKDIMLEIREAINVAKDPEYAALYNDVHETVLAIDPQADLRWWSQNRGVDMPMSWPAFEEYSPDFHAIARKSRRDKPADSGEGVTITAIKKQPETPSVTEHYNAPTAPEYYNGGTVKVAAALPAIKVSTTNQTIENYEYTRMDSKVTSERQHNSLNPFEMDDETDITPSVMSVPAVAASTAPGQQPSGGYLVDDGRRGITVRALYDYTGAEEDELSFTAGEMFEKLEDEDEQGWCTGRKDGRVGLYPANYVESMAS